MAFSNVISRSDAQATIPEQVSNVILANLQSVSAALTLFRRVPMSTNQTRMPVLAALPVAYFINGDTGLKQTTEVNWANKFLNVEEIATIVPIPENVLDDTSFDVWGSIRPLLEQAIGRCLDAAIFFGANKPASWPADIATAAIAAGNVVARGTNAAAAGGIAGDISDLLATLEADGYDANALIGHTAYKGRLRQARTTQGERLLDVDVNNNRVDGIDIAYPMRGQWPSGLSVAELFALDRNEQILGVRKDISYKLLDQAVIQDNTGAILFNLAQQDMVAMRVTARFAWATAATLNYDQATDANRYPAAVLRSPAA